MIGLPLFALDLILSRAGYRYSPQWLLGTGLTTLAQQSAAILGAYVIAYVAGRSVGSPQRLFNRARLEYESVIARTGYWFDHRSSLSSYITPDVKVALERVDALYNRILQDITQQRGREPMSNHNLIVLHYQRALLYCTLGRYADARSALDQAKQVRRSLQSSSRPQNRQEQTFESQLLFLEGEIAVVEGRSDDARTLFQQSQQIDRSLGDTQGIRKNQERLHVVEKTRV
jgi:tetratricopeptide (TPR) repeat protein